MLGGGRSFKKKKKRNERANSPTRSGSGSARDTGVSSLSAHRLRLSGIRSAGAQQTVGHLFCLFFQAEDGIRDKLVTGVQTCALPISWMLGAKHGAAAVTNADTP